MAFNETFKVQRIPHEWSVETYGRLLEIGGGKERMYKYFCDNADTEPFSSVQDDAARKELMKKLHLQKTAIFQDMIEQGQMPLRPGVKELIEDAISQGVKVAVCSTSNEKAVQTIVDVLLGERISRLMRVFAGDMVPAKKPDPAIYLLAADTLDVRPARCVVVEDSRIGLLAAKRAGMRCVITKSGYTQDENFDIADAVFDCIGGKGDERFQLDDLTTPGTFWLNPPSPGDEF